MTMTADDLTAAFTQAAAKPAIVCDIDNTLSFEREAECTALNARFGLRQRASDLQQYRLAAYINPTQDAWLKQLRRTAAFWLNLAPDWRGIDALAALHRAGFFIVVATHRHPTQRSVTQAWLGQWGVLFDSLLVGPGNKEGYVTQHPGSVVFDDNPQSAVTIPAAGGTVWLPQRPWTPAWCDNVVGAHVFTDWSTPLTALGVSPV